MRGRGVEEAPGHAGRRHQASDKTTRDIGKLDGQGWTIRLEASTGLKEDLAQDRGCEGSDTTRQAPSGRRGTGRQDIGGTAQDVGERRNWGQAGASIDINRLEPGPEQDQSRTIREQGEAWGKKEAKATGRTGTSRGYRACEGPRPRPRFLLDRHLRLGLPRSYHRHVSPFEE
jgi:hypothetical protein